MSDLWNSQRYNVAGQKLADDKPAIPCGLVAKSFFNDTFKLNYCLDEGCTKSEPVVINEDGIAWESDKTYKFANSKDLPAGTTW